MSVPVIVLVFMDYGFRFGDDNYFEIFASSEIWLDLLSSNVISTCWTRPDRRLDPRSDWISFGSSTKVNFIKAFVIVWSGDVSQRYRLWKLRRCAHDGQVILVSWLVLQSGPTQSMITRLNDSSKARMGFKGVPRIFWFGLPPTWQVWHIF